MLKDFVAPFVLALAIFTVSDEAKASWLSEITGIDIDLNRGTVSVKPPKPEAIVPMIQNLPKDVGQAILNPLAPHLATAIRWSRGQALNSGVQPIPSHIKSALAPHFPSYILEKVRWRTKGSGLTIDNVLANWLGQEGAVTLDDVIIFSSDTLPVSNSNSAIEIWAHELTHVMQYQNMGVETFAFVYTTNFSDIESQANDNAKRILALVNSGGSTSMSSTQVSSGSFENQIEWKQVNNIGMKVINPVSCIWIQGGMTGNNCPIPVMVSEVIVQNGYGQQFQIPCNQPTCLFKPNVSGPLLSPPGTQIVGVTAAYQPI